MARLLEFARSQNGASAVEFAIVVPFLVFMLMGIIQISTLFFMQNNMVNAARETARDVAIGEITEVAVAETAAAERLVNWGGSFDITVAIPEETADPDDTDVVVTISIPLAEATVVSFLDAFEIGDLRASVTMRSEGF